MAEKLQMFDKHRRIISLLLIIFILQPFLLVNISSSVYSASTNWTEKNSWLKGVLLMLVSFIINRFSGIENPPDETEQNNKEDPVIKENTAEVNNDTTEKNREVLGFHVNWLSASADSYQSLRTNHKNIDIVAPFWYTVKADGSIKTRYGGYQYEVASYAKNRNIKVMPLINNSQENNMILIDPATRKKAVNNIIDLVDKYNYEGVNIDFEFIPQWTRDGYTSFIKELSTRLRKMEKMITISVFPKINVPIDLQGAYDYSKLSPLVDRMVIMTYDNHWSTGPAGPIAPIDWVEKNIKYALEYLPADKILLGIANYGYNWADGYGTTISTKQAQELADNRGIEIKWHKDYQTPYFYYNDENGEKHEVWFESSNSLSFKLDLVNKYNLRGIGIWRLGNADNKFWENIENKIRL
ncbi:MAG: glycosyl hydrolase family 18 protein [Halanaerobiaceae bacterium]